MNTTDLATGFEVGTVNFLDKQIAAESLAWNAHPKFQGVALKHLVTGADTGGRFSLHLVHVAAGCEIGDHVHAAQYEVHEVLDGTGRCVMGEKTIAYAPGVCAVIPEGVQHRVMAADSDGDLYLLATFVPPLV